MIASEAFGQRVNELTLYNFDLFTSIEPYQNTTEDSSP